MQPTPRHVQAEADFRRLIANHDLPDPDDVEYTRDSVYFRWDEQKLVVAVDFDDPALAPTTRSVRRPEGMEAQGSPPASR